MNKSMRKFILIALLFVPLLMPANSHAATFKETVAEASKAYDKGDYKAAAKAYEEAAELKPDSAIIQYNLGLCHQELGHSEEAAAAFGKYLELNPNAPDADEIRGLVASLKGSDGTEEEEVPAIEKKSAPPKGWPSSNKKKEKIKSDYKMKGAISFSYWPSTFKISSPIETIKAPQNYSPLMKGALDISEVFAVDFEYATADEDHFDGYPAEKFKTKYSLLGLRYKFKNGFYATAGQIKTTFAENYYGSIFNSKNSGIRIGAGFEQVQSGKDNAMAYKFQAGYCSNCDTSSPGIPSQKGKRTDFSASAIYPLGEGPIGLEAGYGYSKIEEEEDANYFPITLTTGGFYLGLSGKF